LPHADGKGFCTEAAEDSASKTVADHSEFLLLIVSTLHNEISQVVYQQPASYSSDTAAFENRAAVYAERNAYLLLFGDATRAL
jgi:hypothetical protein